MPNATATITALLVKDGQLSPVEIASGSAQDALNDIYRLTECDIVEPGAAFIGERGDQQIALLVDEEALLKDAPGFCCFVHDENGVEYGIRPIYGRGAILVGNTRSGNWRSLTEREIAGFQLHRLQLKDDQSTHLLTYARPERA